MRLSHPLKNVVTQALGGSTEPQADIFELTMLDGDLVLLCSDGLNSMLADSQIEDLLNRGGTLEEIAEAAITAVSNIGREVDAGGPADFTPLTLIDSRIQSHPGRATARLRPNRSEIPPVDWDELEQWIADHINDDAKPSRQ